MTYIYDRSVVDLSCCGYLVYNWGIIVLHVFTSFLGGVPLCIPYGSYNGTPLGGTTQGILEGYPGRVLSQDLYLLFFICQIRSQLNYLRRDYM